MSTDVRRPLNSVRPLLRVRQMRQFTDEMPTDEELGAIADVARWSGSSKNTQPKNPPGKARLPREGVVFDGRWDGRG